MCSRQTWLDKQIITVLYWKSVMAVDVYSHRLDGLMVNATRLRGTIWFKIIPMCSLNEKRSTSVEFQVRHVQFWVLSFRFQNTEKHKETQTLIMKESLPSNAGINKQWFTLQHI